MNKTELISSIAEKAGVTKKVAEGVLNAYLETTQETLAKGEKIVLVGFGSFEVKNKAARQGRNPKNNEIITIPATKAVKFTAGKVLKDSVNQ